MESYLILHRRFYQKFMPADGIYGFKTILSGMSAGQRSFGGHQFDYKPAVKSAD